MNKIINNKILVLGALVLIVGIFSVFAESVHAVTPTVTATVTGNGDGVLLGVTGDSNSNVIVTYISSITSLTQTSSIGNTDSLGSFSLTISTASFGISPGSLFHVTVNNQVSSSMTWPYPTSSLGVLSLSQTSLSLTPSQSSVVTVYNGGTGSIYISNNTNPSVAYGSVSGTQVTVTANTIGSTAITICSSGNSYCTALFVTVQNASAQGLTFSPNNVSVSYGQTVSVYISGGTGTYTVVSNSNTNAIQAAINGSTVNLYSNGTTGSAVINICTSNMLSCGVINATANTAGSSSINFSQANPTLSIGQTIYVTISGGSGSYYILSSSNTSIAQSSITGNTLSLYGLAAGYSSITVCSSGTCGYLGVTVNTTNNSALTLSQTNISLSPGQVTSIYIYGSGGYYISSNTNPSVASASISGSTATVTGIIGGTDSIIICQSNSQCSSLYVTVSGTTTSSSSGYTPVLSQVLSIGQGVNMMISGGQTPYYLSSNPGTIFTASISNSNVLTLYGVGAGISSINVCSTNGGCVQINVVVINPTASSASTNTSSYKFYNPLKVGLSGNEVTELQKRLENEGLFSGSVTGYYGSLTEAAVKKYQTLHNLTPLGNVGPGTRAALNGK